MLSGSISVTFEFRAKEIASSKKAAVTGETPAHEHGKGGTRKVRANAINHYSATGVSEGVLTP